MLPTSAGVEPVTSWSPVRRRIQLSHRGRNDWKKIVNDLALSPLPYPGNDLPEEIFRLIRFKQGYLEDNLSASLIAAE